MARDENDSARITPADELDPDVQEALDRLMEGEPPLVLFTIDDALWTRLRSGFPEPAVLELLLLAGFYRTTAYLVNSLRLPQEPGTARFADYRPPA